MNFQEIFPIDVNYQLFHFFDLFKKKDLTYNTKNRKIFFLDAADYNNIGDLAIAEAIRNFCLQYEKFEYIEISCEEYPMYYSFLNKSIQPDDLICLTGGGNMGIAYQKYEGLRRHVIKKFPKNNIIIFPQTIDYGSSNYGIRQLKRAREIYSNHENLYLCVREKKSYEIASKYFKGIHIFLVPDIVFFLKNHNKSVMREGILKYIRNDKESNLSNQDREIIEKTINCSNLNVYETDMVINFDTKITMNDRKKIIECKLQEFKRSQIVITDRLHAMIFSAITATPCIVMNNNNHKIRGVYEWINDLSYIHMVDDINLLPKVFDTLLNHVVRSDLNYNLPILSFEALDKLFRSQLWEK